MTIESFTGSVLDNIFVGICMIDKDYNIVFWNEYMESYTGLSKSEVHQKVLYNLFPTFASDVYRERIGNIFDGWPPVVLSSRLHSPFFVSTDENEKKRFQEITITPQTGTDFEVAFAVITVTDVTTLTIKLDEQKILNQIAKDELKWRTEMQNKLQQSELELKELNSTKDKFFSIIAHDLRSPFNAIINLTELLTESIEEKDYQFVDEYSQAILSSSRKTYSLLINLLDWARLQTGRIDYNPGVFNLRALVAECIEVLYMSAKNKSIAIEPNLSDSILVYVDANMIRTVIRNLLSNALKYSEKGCAVTVTASVTGSVVTLYVKDTGVGIKSEYLDKLFRIDTQFTTRGTSNEAGTGLGLILCKEFVKKNKGEITVESEFGKGSTFIFTMPGA